jgi:hypothetical protein
MNSLRNVSKYWIYFEIMYFEINVSFSNNQAPNIDTKAKTDVKSLWSFSKQ